MAESTVEEAALSWLRELGWAVAYGPAIAPGEPAAERTDFGQVLLLARLRGAVARLNPHLPPATLDEAVRKVARPASPSLVADNHAFHAMLVDGVEVEHRRRDGSIAGDRARLIDFADADANDWLAVNQFTVIEGQVNRRPDLVLFVNGLPLVVAELKNPADEDATIWTAFHQLQTYKQQIPSLFAFNEALVVSDGLEARIGTLTADRERFMPWRTIEGEELAPAAMPQLEVLIRGAFDRPRLLDLLRHFIVFEEEEDGTRVKKLAGYHQFHAVRRAVEATAAAAGPRGDRRCGVVWHTQGSGKSLTMVFYAGRIVLDPAMKNPTLVVLTDRNDLDDQLFGTFARCHELLRQTPRQATDRADLRRLLQVASGGVVFTTIQKFFPEEQGDSTSPPGPRRAGRHPLLSNRRNIVVIADEAHRSQYDFIDGFARHLRDALPNASFIGFTGTPVELADKNTRAVFGEYISVYDIERAVRDGATVPIYYEGRLARLELDEREKPRLDEQFDEATEGEEVERKERLKTKWAALEALVGAEKRVRLIARDLIEHFELRAEALDGKGMIVCMSRRICVEVYKALVALRPSWHDEADDRGAIKIVMTGSASDPFAWQGHIRNKPRREALARRFKDSKDPLRLVIVRDMWLTGFDVPCLHTMYVDKPMRGHGLMQALARVNRVFGVKRGGLVVDYLGLADQLRRALAEYTEGGGSGRTVVDQEEAVAVMLEKYEVCCDLFHGFDWSAWRQGTAAEQVRVLPAAQEHILAERDGKERLLKSVTELTQAFALAVPHEEALRIRDDVGFFQAVRSALAKSTAMAAKSDEKLDHAIRQIVSRAVASEGVIDIFAAAGLEKPDLSILSDEFLAEVRGLLHKNLAVELLRKLLAEEIKARARKNVVQSRSFLEMLERAVKAYSRRAIETAQVIEELIRLAKEVREAGLRGEKLGLTEDEVAFYDALETNDSAVKVLGDQILRTIARELVDSVKKTVSIDWAVKESVRAKLRVLVKRILRKYGYPPDKQEKATQTVLEQAELLSGEWDASGAVVVAEGADGAPTGGASATGGTAREGGAEPSRALGHEPFRRLVGTPPVKVRYKTCVPLVSLQAAAGGFGQAQEVEPACWVEPGTKRKLRKGMFVARVAGKSMEPAIPDGSWCLFASPVEGSRDGRIVLVAHRDIRDPETAASYTVKRYKSRKLGKGAGKGDAGKSEGDRGSWRHTELRLEPANSAFKPIVLRDVDEGEVAVVAELVEVIEGGQPHVRE
ncbi:MAG: HsdR family type I site-specific deoxyribonuclease [Planctomycetes bacterium]|nr:HsdR family type I site-specific deoxyribonuclease [Planctomycetota bacterium]